jgi:hypothetical protein
VGEGLDVNDLPCRMRKGEEQRGRPRINETHVAPRSLRVCVRIREGRLSVEVEACPEDEDPCISPEEVQDRHSGPPLETENLSHAGQRGISERSQHVQLDGIEVARTNGREHVHRTHHVNLWEVHDGTVEDVLPVLDRRSDADDPRQNERGEVALRQHHDDGRPVAEVHQVDSVIPGTCRRAGPGITLRLPEGIAPNRSRLNRGFAKARAEAEVAPLPAPDVEEVKVVQEARHAVEELPWLLWLGAGSAEGQLEGTALEQKIIRSQQLSEPPIKEAQE